MATFNSHVVRFGLFSAVILLLLARPAQSASLGEKTATEDAKAVSLVRSALENELVGQNEERENLLWEAFRQSPESAAVRWHLGQVRSEDKSKWLTPSQVELLAQNDKRLAEYRKHRDAAGSSLADQVALAQWCRKNKLDEEERIHWLVVLQLQPDYPEAVQRLDLHPYQGRMLTNEQIVQLNEQSRKLGKITDRWRPLAIRWRQAIDRGEPAPSTEAREKIAKISDLTEMRALQRAISQEAGVKKYQLHAMTLALARTLEGNPHPAAAECLANLAVSSEWIDVRDASIAGLKRHPVDHYVPLLLAGLQTLSVGDVRFEANRNGSLTTRYSVYRDNAIADFTHTARKAPEMPDQPAPLVTPISLETTKTGQTRPLGNRVADWQLATTIEAERQSEQNEQLSNAQAAQRETAMCNAVANTHRAIARSNARVVDALDGATGLDLGQEPMNWWTWWWQEYNETYDITNGNAASPAFEPNLFVIAPYLDETAYQPEYRSEVTQRYRVTLPRRQPPSSPTSCFAPGTKVWTQLGRVPIGQIKVGDRVLAQNVDNGELAYKPVLAVTVRKPGPRMKIGFGQEKIIATPSHPFWRDGKGWQMTKQLEIGNCLHTLSGGMPVESIEDVETDPTLNGYSYNLIVADFSSYFVGNHGILVHDNTPRLPTSSLVPGLPAEVFMAVVRDP